MSFLVFRYSIFAIRCCFRSRPCLFVFACVSPKVCNYVHIVVVVVIIAVTCVIAVALCAIFSRYVPG